MSRRVNKVGHASKNQKNKKQSEALYRLRGGTFPLIGEVILISETSLPPDVGAERKPLWNVWDEGPVERRGSGSFTPIDPRVSGDVVLVRRSTWMNHFLSPCCRVSLSRMLRAAAAAGPLPAIKRAFKNRWSATMPSGTRRSRAT